MPSRFRSSSTLTTVFTCLAALWVAQGVARFGVLVREVDSEYVVAEDNVVARHTFE